MSEVNDTREAARNRRWAYELFGLFWRREYEDTVQWLHKLRSAQGDPRLIEILTGLGYTLTEVVREEIGEGEARARVRKRLHVAPDQVIEPPDSPESLAPGEDESERDLAPEVIAEGQQFIRELLTLALEGGREDAMADLAGKMLNDQGRDWRVVIAWLLAGYSMAGDIMREAAENASGGPRALESGPRHTRIGMFAADEMPPEVRDWLLRHTRAAAGESDGDGPPDPRPMDDWGLPRD